MNNRTQQELPPDRSLRKPPVPFGDDWATLQGRFLIPYGASRGLNSEVISLLEDRTGLCRKTLYHLQQSQYAVPAHTAAAICAALNDFSYFRLLLERVGMLVGQAKSHDQLPDNYLRHICGDHMQFFDLTEKVLKGEALKDEEQMQLEQHAEDMKAEISAFVERARQLREQKRNKK